MLYPLFSPSSFFANQMKPVEFRGLEMKTGCALSTTLFALIVLVVFAWSFGLSIFEMITAFTG